MEKILESEKISSSNCYLIFKSLFLLLDCYFELKLFVRAEEAIKLLEDYVDFVEKHRELFPKIENLKSKTKKETQKEYPDVSER